MNQTIREFPASNTIEKSVLSVLLQYPEKLDEAPTLSAAHFHTAGHAEFFGRLSDMIRANGKNGIDMSTLIDGLARSGALDRMGGPAALSDIATYAPFPSHFQSHVKSLNAFLARRMAVLASIAVFDAAYDAEDVGELVDALSSPISAIHDTLADIKPPTNTKTLIASSLGRYEERVKGISSPMGILTGIDELDNALRGLKPSRMWVIGAYPSGGKSVLAGQIAINAAVSGSPCVFVTLEMSEDDIMDRMITQASSCPALAFSDPKQYAMMQGKDGPTKEILNQIRRSATTLNDSPLAIRKPSNRSLAAVLSTIRRANREMGAVVAVVDYVQLVSCRAASKEQEVSEISHAFQEIAGELGLHIIVLTQLNAEGDTKHGRVIEEDADAFIQIVQEMDKKKPNYKQHQNILIVKDRHHSKGGERLPLVFDSEYIRFIRGFPDKPDDNQRRDAGF
jgi:replicative DNA helicase